VNDAMEERIEEMQFPQISHANVIMKCNLEKNNNNKKSFSARANEWKFMDF
jgi:hypothetical protein